MGRGLEAWIPIGMPALGGLAGVIWVNAFKMDFINPVLGIGGGILLGWIAGRIVLKLMQRRR
ncbi:hypothetical protein ACS3QZ_04680 [Shimia sp. W99]